MIIIIIIVIIFVGGFGVGDPRVAPEGCGPDGWGPEGWGPKGWGPKGWGPKGWGPKGWGPKISRFFPLFRLPFSLFLSLSGGLLVEFWWCFLKRRVTQMYMFGVLELSCEEPAGPKSPGLEGVKNENCGKRGKKRACCALMLIHKTATVFCNS